MDGKMEDTSFEDNQYYQRDRALDVHIANVQDSIKSLKGVQKEQKIEKTDYRALAVAITKLEEAEMWLQKSKL